MHSADWQGTMTEPRWVALRWVMAVHEEQLAEHGGGTGVRDQGLLESALARPQNLWSYGEPAPDLAALAAAYAYGIAKNHAFVDGNKRTALVVSFGFFWVNGYRVTTSQSENAVIFEQLAAGELEEEQLANWFRNNSEPK
jgi:death on curing protein